MKNIVLIPNKTKDIDLSLTKRVMAKLHECGAEIYIEEKYRDVIFEYCTLYSEFPSDAELIIVIGGDGSMLDASVYATTYNIPMLGVNLGKVGYLAEVEPDNLDVLSTLTANNFNVYEKMLLSVSANKSNEIITSSRLAVNDIVISHEDYLGIADFTLYSREGGIKYRADGMVVSTPAGSTAYSLSAGGPIVSHNVNAMVATPICPHSFFNRPIIFSDNELICIKNTGKGNLNVSVDGRCFSTLCPSDSCEIRVSQRKLKIVSFKENNMFSALFKKIRILEDM